VVSGNRIFSGFFVELGWALIWEKNPIKPKYPSKLATRGWKTKGP